MMAACGVRGRPLRIQAFFENAMFKLLPMASTMIAVTTLALACLVLAPESHADEKWPLVINADSAWQIEYRGNGIHFFNLTRPEGENVFFTFSKWPAPGGREQIPVFLRQIANSLAQEGETKLIPFVADEGYSLEKIIGDSFSGEAAIFRNWDGTLLVIFMVSDGDGIWKGQYSGSKTTWEKAKIVLQNLQRAEMQTVVTPHSRGSR